MLLEDEADGSDIFNEFFDELVAAAYFVLNEGEQNVLWLKERGASLTRNGLTELEQYLTGICG